MFDVLRLLVAPLADVLNWIVFESVKLVGVTSLLVGKHLPSTVGRPVFNFGMFRMRFSTCGSINTEEVT
jgi:hypothetical protein